MEAAGAIEVAASRPGLIPNPSWDVRWSWGQFGYYMEPCQTKLQPAWFCASVVFKLPLLYLNGLKDHRSPLTKLTQGKK